MADAPLGSGAPPGDEVPPLDRVLDALVGCLWSADQRTVRIDGREYTRHDIELMVGRASVARPTESGGAQHG